MTGRDLIVYILSNRLENQKIEEGNLVPVIHNYMNESEVASALGVGVATIKVWFKMEYFSDFMIRDDTIYISKDEVIKILSEKLKKAGVKI